MSHQALTGTFDNNGQPTGNKMINVDCTCATPHCQLPAGGRHVPIYKETFAASSKPTGKINK